MNVVAHLHCILMELQDSKHFQNLVGFGFSQLLDASNTKHFRLLPLLDTCAVETPVTPLNHHQSIMRPMLH